MTNSRTTELATAGQVKEMSVIAIETIPTAKITKALGSKLTKGLLKKKLSAMWKEILSEVKVLTLEFLTLVEEGIIVASTTLRIKDFFRHRSGTPKLYIQDNFKNWILDNAPETIEFGGETLSKFKLTKNMYDSEICKELGDPEPFTVSELLGTLKSLIGKQSRGEDGILLTNGYANIFYVKLEDGRTVAVHAFWDSADAEWNLYAWGVRWWVLACGLCCFLPQLTYIYIFEA